MKKLSEIFKVLARIVGVLCIIYGFILGFGGTGPDGPHQSLLISGIGIYIFFLGIFYVWPNQYFSENLIRSVNYLAITSLPILGTVGFAAYSINTDGWHSFVIQGGHISL